MFRVPESIDVLIAALENPHIPSEERLAREDDHFIQFLEEDKATEVLSIKLGTVPEWLGQRFKSKFGKKKETAEEKNERTKKGQEERQTQKRKRHDATTKELQDILNATPSDEADLQAKRDWDFRLMQGVHRMLSSPRAKRKVGQYVAKRRKTDLVGSDKKAALLKELTTLKDDGGSLDGGINEETYNAKMLKLVAKKAQKKEDDKKTIAMN